MNEGSRYTSEMIAEYTRLGFWQPPALADIWDANAVKWAEAEAVVDSRTRLTWSAAKQWIDSIAAGFLAHGLKKGDLVVLQLPNSVELCLARVACEKAGLLYLPVLRTLRDADMEYILGFTRASGVVVLDAYRGFDYVRMIEAARPRLPDLRKIFVAGHNVPGWSVPFLDIIHRRSESNYAANLLGSSTLRSAEVSFICSTTGTTGFPKFAQYTAAARLTFARGVIEALGLNSDDALAALSPAPSGPNVGIYFGAPQVGARTVFLERFEAEEALKLLSRERVTVACGVPAQMALILQHPRLTDYDLSALRAWWSTGAELPYPLAKEFQEKTGAKVINDYGAVDFGGIVAGGIEDTDEVRLLTVGKPRAGTEIKLVGDDGRELVGRDKIGEVLGRGMSCCGGYYLDPESTRNTWTSDGWFATGDLGKIDSDGNLVIVGRQKDMIIRGGWNIYPKEIEGILLSHPGIKDAALVGMPDPIMGERLCAYLVVSPSASVSFAEVISFLKDRGLPSYKLPERLEFIDLLPMVADNQKVDKKALRQDIVEKLKAEGKIWGESPV